MRLIIGKEFSWDIQECIPHHFQATGTCTAPAPEVDCYGNGECPTTTIVSVMACDVQEACKLIKEKIANFKLARLVMFTRPALTRDVRRTNLTDPLCNVDVTPGCVGECCDLIAELIELGGDPSSDSAEEIIAEEQTLITRDGPRRAPEFLLAENSDEIMYDEGGYTFYGSGILGLTGSAEVVADDMGDIGINLIFEEEILDDQVIETFSTVETSPLPQVIETVQLDCCPAPFTLILELKHTFHKIKPFALFLQTNGLTIPGKIVPLGTKTDFIKLNYNLRNDQWQGNLNFTGQSPFGNFNETWGFGIQFGCEGNQWKFALNVINQQPTRRFLSRLLTYYSLDTVCPSNAFFGFRFNIDVERLVSIPITSQSIVVNDDAGFFRNLQMAFRILPQNIGSGSRQFPADNDAAFKQTLTGGK